MILEIADQFFSAVTQIDETRELIESTLPPPSLRRGPPNCSLVDSW